MGDNIHKPKGKGNTQSTPIMSDYIVTYVNKDGVYVSDDSPKVAAKISLNSKTNIEKYFIKSCHGELYNPSDFEVMRRSQITEMEHIWKWVEVPIKAFKTYLHFLQTKNPAFYSMTSRDIE